MRHINASQKKIGRLLPLTSARDFHDHANAMASVIELVGSWWFNYDEWNPHLLRGLLTDEFAFSCRSDGGATEYEDFIRADISGAEAVMDWQADHRCNSPYPVRHNSSCLHITGWEGSVVEFASYIFVTKIVGGRPLSLSSGTARGAARITEHGMLMERLSVVLDTTDSVPLREVRRSQAL